MKTTIVKTDRIHGIERNPDSPLFDQLVVPQVILWRAPALRHPLAREVTGKLAHGDEVMVTKQREVSGAEWCYVSADAVDVDGQVYPQRGWLRASLLKDAGAAEYD